MAARLRWTQEVKHFLNQEQQYLKEIRENVGGNKWAEIARKINVKFPNRFRNGKQCRDHFMNFLQDMNQTAEASSWSEEEVENLYKYFQTLGSKWA